ncbi:MAG TPA: molybdopterin-dependent oxidoreductase, partial [Candidatus Binatia bacterium]|nr:molybdopterin-dependent oxidoreductase [Candidatus Binatia bacterium]
MTNHWRDIKNADLILVNGANPAEAHPVGFQWFMRAKLDRGAKIVHTDPRYTRTSAVADRHLRIRTGTDIAYFGGLINYVLQNGLHHADYVNNYTNAAFVVKDGYAFDDGLFNSYDQAKRTYDPNTWGYETGPDGYALRDVGHPRSVLNLLKQHYARYTPEMVERITGIPRAQFLEVAKLVGEMGRPDKVMTIVYAVGLTHHTTGVQLIRS